MVRKIPERWEDYSNMGRQIPGTRFLAFKVPLKKALLDNLPSSVERFDPRILSDHCSSLGLVIDLTNTNRYYDPEVYTDLNIQYEKLNTVGHVIPEEAVVKKFFNIVETFSRENAENDKVIGVHCTHGVNRTGYLICRYMIQQLGVPPDQAIADFSSARGHEIERINYLDDLRTAPWLVRYRKRRGKRSLSADGEDEELLAGRGAITPPYMPHKSRRSRISDWEISPMDQHPYRRFSKSPLGRRSASFTPNTPGSDVGPDSQGRKVGRKRKSSSKRFPSGSFASPEGMKQRGLKRTASTMEREDEREDGSPEETFKSPKFGKLYYEQYFKGQVLPQYDMDFYMKRDDGGLGPHRPQKGAIAPSEGRERHRPRNRYRGPKPYQSPPDERESLSYSSNKKTPKRETMFSPQGGESSSSWNAKRNQTFSPNTTQEMLSPEARFGRRRSSQRFQPY